MKVDQIGGCLFMGESSYFENLSMAGKLLLFSNEIIM